MVIAFLGRIKAVQLEYTEAHKNLLQAIRKAPQHTAVGFKQTVSTCTVYFRHIEKKVTVDSHTVICFYLSQFFRDNL